MARGRMLGGLVVAGLLLLPARGRADIFDWWGCKHCPPPSYPVCHYWTPELYKVWACFHGPKISQYSVLRYPELPVVNETHPYPCPTVVPVDFWTPYLLPVPESQYPRQAREKKDAP
jgi:hypothetical protein